MAHGLKQISSTELTEWQAFYELEGFGEDRMDIRFANTMAQQANIWNDKDKRPQGWKLTDFLPEWLEPEVDQDELRAAAKARFLSMVSNRDDTSEVDGSSGISR